MRAVTSTAQSSASKRPLRQCRDLTTLSFLGDLYTLAGRPADAQTQYDTVGFIHSLAAQQTGGAVYDREYSLFLPTTTRTPPPRFLGRD